MSRTFEPPPGRRVFSRSFTPTDADIDANGHVNNVVYLGWAQDLAIAHWDSAVGIDDSEALAWVALRHEVDYRRALLPGETAQGRTWVSDKAEGPRFDRFVRIDGPDGVMCAQVRTVWCLIDRASGRPRRVPAELIARFG